MRRFRFSIGSLIGFILICGVAFAALKESSEMWENATFTLTLLVLLTSVLLATHRSGARRAFWPGFALFGSVYLGLALIPPIETRLVTSKGLGYLHSKLPGQVVQNVVLSFTTTGSGSGNQQSATIAFSPGGNRIATVQNSTVRVWNATTGQRIWGGSVENFVKIGHSLIALLLACLGGIISRRLAGFSAPIEGPSQLTGLEP